jgi:hypothetical protein
MAIKAHRAPQVLLESTEPMVNPVQLVLRERQAIQALKVLQAHQARPQVLLEPIVMWPAIQAIQVNPEL